MQVRPRVSYARLYHLTTVGGALSCSDLERIVVDLSHIDQKKRGILDIRETQQPLMALLNRPEIKERYSEGEKPIQILCY